MSGAIRFSENFSVNDLRNLSNRTLFYPCSARDMRGPVSLFAQWINTFWFVDIGYFSNADPENSQQLMNGNSQFQFVDRSIRVADLPEEAWINDVRYHGIPPYILTERYLHRPTSTIITIHRHRRRGPSALRTEIGKLGVFFYRGDSLEGSGTMWLTAWKKQVKHKTALPLLIIDKIVDNGFIVTDGSMCEIAGNPYKFFKLARGEVEKLHTLKVDTYKDSLGNIFTCVGFIGSHYNRISLIWRVTKSIKDSV